MDMWGGFNICTFFFLIVIKSHSNLDFVKNHELLCLAIRVPPARGLSVLLDKCTTAAEWRFWSSTVYDWVRELWDRTQARSCYLYWAEWLSSTSGSLGWGDTFTKQQIVLSVWRKRNPNSLGVSDEAMEGVGGWRCLSSDENNGER